MQNQSFNNVIYAERLATTGANLFSATATYWGPDKRIHLAQPKEMRFYYNLDTGEKEGILLEASTTNNVNSSCDFSRTSAWGNPGTGFILNTAESLVDGQVAMKHTLANSGVTHGRNQLIGPSVTSSSNIDCAFAIVENVDATQSAIGIRDGTAGKWICYARFNWTTGTITETLNEIGTYYRAYAKKLMDTGPNGGPVYQIIAIGGNVPNSANLKYMLIYPCGSNALPNTSAQTSVIMHACQYEPQKPFPSSLVITANNNVTRFLDRLAVNINREYFSSEQGTFVVTVKKTEPGVNPIDTTGIIFLDNNSNRRHLYITGDGFASYDGTTALGAAGVNAVSAVFETVATAYNPTNRYSVANGATVYTGTFVAGYNTATSNVTFGGTNTIAHPGIVIKDIQYYPYKLPDANLRALTTRANN